MVVTDMGKAIKRLQDARGAFEIYCDSHTSETVDRAVFERLFADLLDAYTKVAGPEKAAQHFREMASALRLMIN
jgi:hypothetical protein